MDRVHRAKIFSPFDALAGFDECIQSQKVLYCEKRILTEGEMDDLNEKLSHLHSLTYNSQAARLNRPVAAVEYFIPCSDPQNEWFGKGGRYITVTGTVSKVDTVISKTITIDDTAIPLADVARISLQQDDYFEEER